MVICGGLEILAAGYILNEFNKDKVEQRERRKRRDTGERPERPHNHSQPPPLEGRPHNLPQHVERPPQNRPNNFLQPPSQGPPRPTSAPPVDARPNGWQNQPPQQSSYAPQQMRPTQPSNPYLQHLQNAPHPAPWQAPMMGPAMQPHFQTPPGPGMIQHANTFQPQQPHPPPNFQNPGPGHLQRPNTFQTPQHMSNPNLNSSNTFPIAQTSAKPPPAGPLIYVDSKTGRISHNMYPPDHPMARGVNGNSGDLSKDLWGDQNYQRTSAGDINTGMMWSDRDEDDLAYGKDHSDRRRRRRSPSYERQRRGRRGSDPLGY